MLLTSKVSLLLSINAFILSDSFTPSSHLLLKNKELFASPAGGFGSTSIENDSKRSKSIKSLEEWAKAEGIQMQGIKVESGKAIIGGGLGLVATSDIEPNTVMLQVPNHLSFTVSNSKFDSNPTSESQFTNSAKAYCDAPWWAKLSLDLYVCDKISSLRPNESGKDQVDMRPWLDSLPRSFDTPLHWTQEERESLQYAPIVTMISAQEKKYRSVYDSLKKELDPSSPLATKWTYDDFVWGCECARSRAFSGAYSGDAFDPKPYALTLLLVGVYVGLNLGTIEQAANGAALVFCGSIFRDFVFPKLFKSKRFIINPMIDMANHVGMREEGNVAFEYFTNGYSVSTRSDMKVEKGKELRISYGPRSNDALLQQYGFVEVDNAHDVYIMPPLKDWDIAALEAGSGRTFQPGRLEKLDRAGLLGTTAFGNNDEDTESFEEGALNRGGGVIVSRATGIDPAVLTALRALVSTEEEWSAAGEAVGNFVTENSGGEANERVVRIVAQRALELELETKETTLEEDQKLLDRMNSQGSGSWSQADMSSVIFRIEKKKLLKEIIFAMSLND